MANQKSRETSRLPADQGRTPARQLLESMQAAAYQNYGKSLAEMRKSWRVIQKNVDDDLAAKQYGFPRTRQPTKRELPTLYENPLTYGILQRLQSEIENVAAELGYSIPVRPVLGTMPSGQVNAMAIWLAESNEYLVLFEAGLITFASLMSKAIVQAFPLIKNADGLTSFSTLTPDVEANLAANPLPIDRFQQAVLAYLLEGNPGRAPRYLLDKIYIDPYWHLLHSMELFVMGHEYGHIIGKHFQEVAPAEPTEPEGDDSQRRRVHELTIMRRNYEKEFEADLKGASLAIRAMQAHRVDVTLSFWGTDLFFGCLDVVERGIGILRDGREPTMPRTLAEATSKTHPPTALRREALQVALAKNYPNDPQPPPLHFSRLVEKVMDMLWAPTRTVLYELRERGQQPHPIWRQVGST